MWRRDEQQPFGHRGTRRRDGRGGIDGDSGRGGDWRGGDRRGGDRRGGDRRGRRCGGHGRGRRRGGGSPGGRGGTAGTGAGGNAAGGDSLAPAQGALLGIYYGAGTQAETDARIGRTPQIHLVYYAWTDDWTQGAKADLQAGRIPLINWEPDGIDFNRIVSGSLDATINARANGAKALNGRFFLDFAAEMNGDEAWSGNNAPLYVSAYKHIHDLFTAAGATNVIWAWCPNVTDTNGTNKTTMDYYPGDAYVDWTGVDGYNWGGGDWQSFRQVFANIYPLLAAKNKPIIIGEMASAEQGGDKGAWIDAMIPTLKAQYPLFKAVVWFDINKENDWRVNSSPAALAAFSKMAKDPYFNP